MSEQNRYIYDNLSDPVKEAYNALRTNIRFYGLDSRIRTITITSCSSGEGKTTTSVNLGISMANAGMKVLFVDADLRKPALVKSFGDGDFQGLSNYLLGHAELDDIINSTNIKGFHFIPCGIKPPNPTVLLGSERFSKLLKTTAEQFELVIIDTPPMGSVIDCSIIAAQTDGTLLVIENGRTKYRNIQMIREQLTKANARILGVVLNKIAGSEYRNYYNEYDYYGGSRKYVKGWLQKLRRGKKE